MFCLYSCNVHWHHIILLFIISLYMLLYMYICIYFPVLYSLLVSNQPCLIYLLCLKTFSFIMGCLLYYKYYANACGNNVHPLRYNKMFQMFQMFRGIFKPRNQSFSTAWFLSASGPDIGELVRRLRNSNLQNPLAAMVVSNDGSCGSK